MSDDFERALAFTLRWEGGKVDDPHDRGGRTNRGVTQRTYDGYREDLGLPRRDVWELEEEEAKAVYSRLYWWPAKAAPWPLSLVVFDCAVLFGPGRASGWLQAASWLSASPEAQAWAILCFRRERHRETIAKDKSQGRFWAGWSNRLNALAEAAGLVAGTHGGSTHPQPVTGEQKDPLAKVDVASSTLVSRSK